LPKEVLVETDFLFGLNAKNNLFPKVLRILEERKKGRLKVIISSASRFSPIEVFLVLLSRNMSYEVITKVIKLMNAKLAEYRINDFAPITLDVVAKALELKMKYRELTLFDSIHISLAKILGIPLLTGDNVMLKVIELEKIAHLSYDAI